MRFLSARSGKPHLEVGGVTRPVGAAPRTNRSARKAGDPRGPEIPFVRLRPRILVASARALRSQDAPSPPPGLSSHRRRAPSVATVVGAEPSRRGDRPTRASPPTHRDGERVASRSSPPRAGASLRVVGERAVGRLSGPDRRKRATSRRLAQRSAGRMECPIGFEPPTLSLGS